MDLAAYTVSGRAPARVERPTTSVELAQVLERAHRAREAVLLWGGGTRVGIGDAPDRYDAAADLRGLQGIVELSPADLVCTVRAGTTLADLAAALTPVGLRWPVEAAHPERATVGGTIASAAPGASRLRHQHVRDWVLGCEAVLGDGTRARAGGRVVKNVTGFDLARLYSGTYGTLAALAEVSLKLVAVDPHTRTFRRGGAVSELARIGEALRTLPLDGLALVTHRETALYVRVAGTLPVVDRLTRELGAHGVSEPVSGEIWQRLADVCADTAIVARLALAPGREALLQGGAVIAYLGTGIAFVLDGSVDDLRALRARCEEQGGALVLERASDAERRALGTWGRSRVPPAIARSLKERFDPHGVLAPGRLPA